MPSELISFRLGKEHEEYEERLKKLASIDDLKPYEYVKKVLINHLDRIVGDDHRPKDLQHRINGLSQTIGEHKIALDETAREQQEMLIKATRLVMMVVATKAVNRPSREKIDEWIANNLGEVGQKT